MPERRIAFRVDASTEMGSGHLMRCLALATALADLGVRSHFVTRAAANTWGDLFHQDGHTVDFLAPGNADWRADLAETQLALSTAAPPDWLVVDHYGLPAEWEAIFRGDGLRVAAIDDIERPHQCDVLLDQNLATPIDRYADRVPAACRRLLGPRYALLRPEFAESREPRRFDGALRDVLIGFGGSDPTDETRKAVRAFLAAPLPGVTATVVVGTGYRHWDELRREFGRNERLHLVRDSHRISDLMARADLAVGAAGSSCWERAALALPSLVIVQADNQEALADSLARYGCHLLLGRSASVTPADIAAGLTLLAGNAPLRESLARRAQTLCDGRGAQRVARLLAERPVTVRAAGPADCDAVHAWRNAEDNRRYSIDPQPIDLEHHRRWYADLLANPDRVLLIGEDSNRPVGVVRLDMAAIEAELSIYLVPGEHGKGYGGALLSLAHGWLRDNRPGVAAVRARVLCANEISLRMFRAAGYVESESLLRCRLAGKETASP